MNEIIAYIFILVVIAAYLVCIWCVVLAIKFLRKNKLTGEECRLTKEILRMWLIVQYQNDNGDGNKIKRVKQIYKKL